MNKNTEPNQEKAINENSEQDGESVESKARQLLLDGHSRFNNLFRMIEQGNICFAEPFLDYSMNQLKEKNEEISAEDLNDKAFFRRFHNDLEEITQLERVSSEDSNRYLQIAFIPDNLTQDDLIFLQNYLGKIERVFNGMVAKGWDPEMIRG